MEPSMTTVRRAWDAMMEHYLPGRSDLLVAAYDEAERVLGRPPAAVLDLGGGPGTTVETVLRRWPGARATLLDLDPVLLELARRALPARVGIRRADLGTPGWTATVDRHEAVLAVMTLHYFPEPRVRRLYRELRDVLVAGGVLLVVERCPTGTPEPADGQHPDEPWTRWWAGLAADRTLRPALAERAAMTPRLASAEFAAPVGWHRAAARDAGYTDARPVCRRADHVVLVVTAG